MKLGNRFFILSLIIFTFYACDDNPLDVDLKGKPIKIEIVDVDSTIINTKEKDLQDVHDRFKTSLGEAYVYEASMNTQNPNNSELPFVLKRFYEGESIKKIEDQKKLISAQVTKQVSKLQKALTYLKHHFQDIPLPSKLVFMNNLFSGIQCTDSTVFVGLERYIDGESEIVKSIPNDQLYQWQKDAMDVEFLARDIVQQWIQVNLFNEKDEHLACHIVQAGKVLYLLNAAFPKENDAFLLRYSQEELEWANKNEIPFWEYLVREEMLFKNNARDKSNFLNEGPYTVGLPEKGPARLGQFLGMKMVKQFMKENKALSLHELLNVEYNTILQAYEIGN